MGYCDIFGSTETDKLPSFRFDGGTFREEIADHLKGIYVIYKCDILVPNVAQNIMGVGVDVSYWPCSSELRNLHRQSCILSFALFQLISSPPGLKWNSMSRHNCSTTCNTLRNASWPSCLKKRDWDYQHCWLHHSLTLKLKNYVEIWGETIQCDEEKWFHICHRDGQLDSH